MAGMKPKSSVKPAVIALGVAAAFLAVISAVFWFIALPVLPIFGLTAIIVNALIIFGLTSSSADAARSAQ